VVHSGLVLGLLRSCQGETAGVNSRRLASSAASRPQYLGVEG